MMQDPISVLTDVIAICLAYISKRFLPYSIFLITCFTALAQSR